MVAALFEGFFDEKNNTAFGFSGNTAAGFGTKSG
jgi:hypothetical protein